MHVDNISALYYTYKGQLSFINYDTYKGQLAIFTSENEVLGGNLVNPGCLFQVHALSLNLLASSMSLNTRLRVSCNTRLSDQVSRLQT